MHEKLNEWFGVTIDEYPSMGHELDVFSVSSQSKKMMVEIIWTPSNTHFMNDLNILQNSDADIKIVIVNPEFYAKVDLTRKFQKTRISELQKGCLVSEMLDGKKILQGDDYLNGEVKKAISELLRQSKIPIEEQIEVLKTEILSNHPLAPILSKCLLLSKQLGQSNDTFEWLKNELYGYLGAPKGILSSENPWCEQFPHNPEYRKIDGEIRIIAFNRNTGSRTPAKTKYPMFFTQPITNLEEINNSSNEEGFLEIEIDDLPTENKDAFKRLNPDAKTVPIVYKKQAFGTCINRLRLELHKFLDDLLLTRDR
jgi:hypothetical protein